MTPPVSVDEQGRPLPMDPCPRPGCGREVPVRFRGFRVEHLKHVGWGAYRVETSVNWCGHRQEVIPFPRPDGLVALVLTAISAAAVARWAWAAGLGVVALPRVVAVEDARVNRRFSFCGISQEASDDLPDRIVGGDRHRRCRGHGRLHRAVARGPRARSAGRYLRRPRAVGTAGVRPKIPVDNDMTRSHNVA
jgi:hypothetical protein